MRKLIVPFLFAAAVSLPAQASERYPIGKITREVAYEEAFGPHCEERYFDARSAPATVYVNKFPFTDLAAPNQTQEGKCETLLRGDDGSLDSVCKLEYEIVNNSLTNMVILPKITNCVSPGEYVSKNPSQRFSSLNEIKNAYRLQETPAPVPETSQVPHGDELYSLGSNLNSFAAKLPPGRISRILFVEGKASGEQYIDKRGKEGVAYVNFFGDNTPLELVCNLIESEYLGECINLGLVEKKAQTSWISAFDKTKKDYLAQGRE